MSILLILNKATVRRIGPRTRETDKHVINTNEKVAIKSTITFSAVPTILKEERVKSKKNVNGRMDYWKI